MIRHYFNPLALLTLVITALIFQRCAQVVPLSGGERDTAAPKLEEAIPAQAATGFTSNVIILRFNEYVQIKDLKNQLLISPKLKTEPEFEAQGKKIKITLKKEELLPNTTYKIYLGKAIADMTEGNTLNGFEYVFSTGNMIDSLKLNGNVKETFNCKAVPDLVVGLFNVSAWNDSTVFKTEPDYITKTNTDGNFTFSYLPDKPFRIVAFSDKNKNKMYDGEIEKVAFGDKPVDLRNDTLIQLGLFQEEPAKTFLKKKIAPFFGAAHLIYNQKSVFTVNLLNPGQKENITESRIGIEKDTITLFYHNITDTLGLLVKNIRNNLTDTIKLPLPKNLIARKKSLGYNSNIGSGVLNITSSPQITFISQLDTIKVNRNKFHLQYLKDSALVSEPAQIAFLDMNKIVVKNKISEGITYKLKVDSAALYDVNERYNDSILLSFKRENKTDLGKLTLKLLLNKKQAYIVQLVNDKDVVIKEHYLSFSLSSSNAASIDFTNVPPGSYYTKIIFDNNSDKKWNTGNYLSKKQAEEVFISSKQIKIVPDWDVEEEIIVK